jgi:hypothetical protein
MAGRIRDEGADSHAASRETPAFDRWLHRQLHALYDSIACEPLPDELIALIDRDTAHRARTQQPGLHE